MVDEGKEDEKGYVAAHRAGAAIRTATGRYMEPSVWRDVKSDDTRLQTEGERLTLLSNLGGDRGKVSPPRAIYVQAVVISR